MSAPRGEQSVHITAEKGWIGVTLHTNRMEMPAVGDMDCPERQGDIKLGAGRFRYFHSKRGPIGPTAAILSFPG